MQEWLDNNNILMYSAHNVGKSVIAEWFIKTIKAKIFKEMTAHNSKSYLAYLNKLIDQYNNTYHHFIYKNLLMLIILLSLKKLSRILRLLNFRLMIESELPNIRIFWVKIITKIGQEKYLL